MSTVPKLKTKRELLDNLDLEERKRKLMSVKVEASGLDSGVSSQSAIDEYIKSLPSEEKEKWHLAWFDDDARGNATLKNQGYELCKIMVGKRNQNVTFKSDLLWRIPKDVYDNRILAQELGSRNKDFEREIEEKDKTAMYGESGDDE